MTLNPRESNRVGMSRSDMRTIADGKRLSECQQTTGVTGN